MKRFLLRVLPHLVLILAVMLLVLVVLNEFNPYMGFLSSGVTRVYYIIFAVLALALSIADAVRDRRKK